MDKSCPDVRLRLLKSDKLRFRKQFEQVRKDGIKYPGRGIVAIVATHPDGKLDCGVICSRKYSLLSVERNRARRLFWETFRQLKPKLLSCRLVLIPRQRMKRYTCQETRDELTELLTQAGVLHHDAV